mmetsp:Transcript_164588/g.523355  ORF Transcript_164588/g.523355 Transcript_164588/m.523355 type:complete len:252 (-) Transcript_164588:878-1633(-)
MHLIFCSIAIAGVACSVLTLDPKLTRSLPPELLEGPLVCIDTGEACSDVAEWRVPKKEGTCMLGAVGTEAASFGGAGAAHAEATAGSGRSLHSGAGAGKSAPFGDGAGLPFMLGKAPISELSCPNPTSFEAAQGESLDAVGTSFDAAGTPARTCSLCLSTRRSTFGMFCRRGVVSVGRAAFTAALISGFIWSVYMWDRRPGCTAKSYALGKDSGTSCVAGAINISSRLLSSCCISLRFKSLESLPNGSSNS